MMFHEHFLENDYDSWGNPQTGKIMPWFNGWQPCDGGLPVLLIINLMAVSI